MARGVSRGGVSEGHVKRGVPKRGVSRGLLGACLSAFMTISPKRATVASTFLHCAREPRLCNVQFGRAAHSKKFHLAGKTFNA